MTIAKKVLGQDSKHYNYNEDVIDRLFFNNLDTPYSSTEYKILTEDNLTVSSKSFYKLNSLQYRSQEFYNVPEIVFSGCSFTYGMGLKEESLWTSILAKKIDKGYVNLGLPGKSVSSIINNLYSYFREYGNPDYVFCLFPDFDRFELPINKDIIISERNISDSKYNSSPMNKENPLDASGYVEDIIITNSNLSEKPKYSQKPHIAENILSIDITYWTAIKSILAFEQYCSEAKIKFYWTTWDRDLNLVINKIKNKYPNQYINFILLDEDYDKNCHSEEMKSNLILWDKAGDRDRGINYAHPGVHFHIHVAEAFYSSLPIDEI